MKKSRTARPETGLVWDFIDRMCVSLGIGRPDSRLRLDSLVLLSVSNRTSGMSAVLRCTDGIR